MTAPDMSRKRFALLISGLRSPYPNLYASRAAEALETVDQLLEGCECSDRDLERPSAYLGVERRATPAVRWVAKPSASESLAAAVPDLAILVGTALLAGASGWLVAALLGGGVLALSRVFRVLIP